MARSFVIHLLVFSASLVLVDIAAIAGGKEGMATLERPRSALTRSSRPSHHGASSTGDEPAPPGLPQLAGSKTDWRIRVGDYRIIYAIADDNRVVSVNRVRHRREVYR